MDNLNIDKDEIESTEPFYLKQSVKVYKINRSLLIFIFIMIVLVKPMFRNNAGPIDMLIGLAFLVVSVLAPAGLIYSWKSRRNKEEPSKLRFKYMMRHSLISILVLGMILSAIVLAISLANN